MPTLRDLVKGTQKVHPKAIKWAPDRNNNPIFNVRVEEFKGVNNLVVRSKQKMSGRWPRGTRPTSRHGVYNQTMRFSLRGSDRSIMNEDKPKISSDRCLVTCGCENYYHMWLFGNQKVKAHEGSNFKKYVKVQNPSRKVAPLNPNNTPGMCKHLVYLMNHLKQEGYIE